LAAEAAPLPVAVMAPPPSLPLPQSVRVQWEWVEWALRVRRRRAEGKRLLPVWEEPLALREAPAATDRKVVAPMQRWVPP